MTTSKTTIQLSAHPQRITKGCEENAEKRDAREEIKLRWQEQMEVISQFALIIADLTKLEKHQLDQGLSADETRGALNAYRSVIQKLRELSLEQEQRWGAWASD
ncbi:MAG: hypothetical protein ACAH95_11525 [Fimbriimonas sp.]